MRTLEIHCFESAEDIDEAIQAGILLEELKDAECNYCGDEVGFLSLDEYFPFCLVLDDEDKEWFVCHKCAEPIICSIGDDTLYKPLENSYIGMLEEDLDFE